MNPPSTTSDKTHLPLSTGMIYIMRDEDEAFADIVKNEYGEDWVPPSSPEASMPTFPANEPLPDFHFNLMDEEERYRQVSSHTWEFSSQTLLGFGLLLGSLILGLIKIIFDLPIWFGWLCVTAFIFGVGLCLWTAIQSPHEDNDDSL